jgi:hypothetical protein
MEVLAKNLNIPEKDLKDAIKKTIKGKKTLIDEFAKELKRRTFVAAMKMMDEEEEEEKTPVKKREKEEKEKEEVNEEEIKKKKKKKEKRDYDEVKADLDGGKDLKDLTIEDLKVLIRKRNETEKPPIKLEGKKEELIEKCKTFA